MILMQARSAVAIAIDVGGTKVDSAIVDATGRIVPGSLFRHPTGPGTTRASLEHAVHTAASRAKERLSPHADLIGVGLGSAGPVDLSSGTVRPVNMPHAADTNLVAVLRTCFADVPIRMALDGTCIALAEHRFGAARGARNALALVVSTGVGGGFILNGQPQQGMSGNAGHLGQIRVRDRDAANPTAGTVESIASGPNTVSWARNHGWGGQSGEELAAACTGGDPIARAAVRRSAGAIGEAVACASTLLDLDVAVIAGGFANVAHNYVKLVQQAAQEAAVLPYARRVRVLSTGLDGDGPLIGAAALALFPE